jgi:general stress protein 26
MANRKEQKTDLTPSEAADRIWELAKEIDICMFVTWDGEYNRARPLSARVHRDDDAIYFLVNDDSAKNEQLAKYPKVTLAWSDSSQFKYVTISGQAAVTNDREKIKQLWEKTDEAWWDSPDDPEIRLIAVTPDEGELWDSPGGSSRLQRCYLPQLLGHSQILAKMPRQTSSASNNERFAPSAICPSTPQRKVCPPGARQILGVTVASHFLLDMRGKRKLAAARPPLTH